MNVAEMFMASRPALAVVGFGTAAGSFGLASDTTAPGVSRYWPRTTTVSPAFKPLSIRASPLSVSRTDTGCIDDLVIRADDKDELPLRPLLDGVERDRQTIVLDPGHDPDIDKHAGPQPAMRIGKDRLEIYRAGGRY